MRDLIPRTWAAVGILTLLGVAAAAGQGAPEAPLPIPAAAQASAHFDPVAATNAYLATVPADKRARSDAYFEGGYWLILWDFLMGVAIYWALLRFGWGAKNGNLAERFL